MGSADLVEERTIETDEWVFIEGRKNPKAVTILVRASSQRVVDEAERSVHDALMATKDVIEYPYVVAGGGAPEDFCHKACWRLGKNMIEVLKYVNPAVKSYGLLPITAKVAFDDGGVLVVHYGKKLEKSHVDIVGPDHQHSRKNASLCKAYSDHSRSINIRYLIRP